MSLNLAVAQRAQYLDNDGKPLSQGRVTYYETGTGDALKAIYADPEGITQLDSELLLDIGGFVPVSGVFYSAGNYSIKVERRTNPEELDPEEYKYALEYMMPNVPGSLDTSTLLNTRVVYVESVEAMANLTPNSYDYVYCFNYYTDNIDNGGGWFRWIPTSTAPTDLGMIFALSASVAIGRNARIYQGNVLSSYYGATPDRGVNMSSRIAQATAWAVSKGETLELVSGNVQIDGTVNIQSCDVQIDAGFSFDRLTPVVTSVLRFNLCNVNVMQVNEEIAVGTDADHYVQFEGDLNFKLYPAWWGAVGDNTTDDFSAFSASANSEGIHQIIRGYKLVGSVAPMLTLDRVHLVDSGFINNGIAVLTVNACTSTEGAYNNFRAVSGDFANYVFNFVGYAKWFFDTTCSDDQLSTLRTALTSKNLIWDRPIEYTLSPLVDNQEYFVNQVKFGTIFKFTNTPNIGLINAGYYRIFSDDSLVPSYINDKILASWWGVSKFSTNAVNEEGIKNAIISSENGTVDFGGGKVQVGASVVIPANTDNVTIKNLFVEVNGASVPALTFTDSIIEIIDSTIEGVETDATCNISLNNCKVSFSDTAQNFTLLGENISVKNCDIGASNWLGTLSLGSVASKATTKSIIYCGNDSEGGRFEITTGTDSNILEDNEFKNVGSFTPYVSSQNYMTINGGSFSTLKGNNFFCVQKDTTESFIFIKFQGSGEEVVGLHCDNNYEYIKATAPTDIQPIGDHTVLGYADSKHRAYVKSTPIDINFRDYSRGTTTAGYTSSATGTGQYLAVADLIFPYYDMRANVADGIPYFWVEGTCDGFTTSDNGLGLYTETYDISGSGGNCLARAIVQLRASTGYGISQVGNLTFSVESQYYTQLTKNALP